MQHVWVRKVESRDVNELDQWLNATANNLADRDVFFYPHSTVNVAFIGAKKLAFMPVQLAAVLESLAINPANSERETAKALAELTKAIVLQSRERGVKEI